MRCSVISTLSSQELFCALLSHRAPLGFFGFVWFLVTVLLRYNSRSIQFTHLKGTIQWVFLVYSQVGAVIASQSQNNFFTSKRNTVHFTYPLPVLLTGPKQPLINFLSTKCLFLTFHIHGILEYMIFSLWLSFT